MSIPPADVVDLWTVDLDGEAPARAAAMLDEPERARAQRIVRPIARERFILARAALRTVLGECLQVAPAAVALREGPRGKPQLGDATDLSFSLSHTRALAVIAVTTRERIGVDVETRGRPIPPAVLRRVLDDRELALVLALPEAAREEAFLRHWTAKEAYVKALGTGLATGLRGVAVRDALTTPALVDEPDGTPWRVQRFDPRPEAIGAVVVSGAAWTARRRNLRTADSLSL